MHIKHTQNLLYTTDSRWLRSQRLLCWVLLCIGLFSAIDSFAEKAADKEKNKSNQLEYSADRNIGYILNGKMITELQGNVIAHYDSITIKADNLKILRDEGSYLFTGGVSMVKKHQSMTCDQVTISKKDKKAIGSGNVVYRDTKTNIKLTGHNATYAIKEKELTLTGKPAFYKYDIAAAETMTVRSNYLVYNDSLSIASARENVVITKGKLYSTCSRAQYYTRKERATLRGVPRITFDINNLDGDSVDLIFVKDTLRGIAVGGNALGKYREVTKKDTALTDISGDSMYMCINARGNVDSIWTLGNVLSTYSPTKRTDTSSQVSGKSMILAFNSFTTELSTALVWGNARSIYYMKDQTGKGKNVSSGDTILVTFEKGKAAELTLAGSVRGSYVPQNN